MDHTKITINYVGLYRMPSNNSSMIILFFYTVIPEATKLGKSITKSFLFY